MADIFLSYHKTDRERVARIAALLDRRGWSVWWDRRLDAGEQWDKVIDREINAAGCVMAVWSSESVHSHWVRTAAREGLERGILVPVLIDRATPPTEFRPAHAIDLTNWNGEVEERPAKTLIDAVARCLGRSAVNAALIELEAEPIAVKGQPSEDPIDLKPIEEEPHRRRREQFRRPESQDFNGLRSLLAALRAVGYTLAWLAIRARHRTPRVVLPALVATAIVVAAPVLHLSGWLGAPQPKGVDALAPELEDVLALAQRRIGKGDLMGARRILTAYEGIAPAPIALAIGETYDPNMLAAWGAQDATADPTKALFFYNKALKLGDARAKRRLDGLKLSEAAAAQGPASGLRIVVDPVIVVAQSPWEAALPIHVDPREGLPRNAFVRLRGLPRAVSLTEGHSVAPGSWAVPVSALPSLKANVPAAVSGRSRITISLIGMDGTILAEARTELVVFALPSAPQAGERLPSVPFLSAEQRKRAGGFVERGWQNWEEGNVAGARAFFQYAADLGLAAGAMGMGMTYDPAQLTRIEAVGLAPDRDEARKWYERARELGAPEADEPLTRLAVK
jgi:TPR repeat protein